MLYCVLVELDLSRDNIFYSIVIDWLYALVGFVSNFSGSNLSEGLSCLGLLLSYLGFVGVVLIVDTYCTDVVPTAPVWTGP
jgi:hypothetical protein